MAKKAENKVKVNLVGRPTGYKPEYADQAKKLCLLGATDKDLADFFGVCEATINNWKHDYPEFLESLKQAKAEADSRVERSLFERACGYEHPEDHIAVSGGTPVITPTVKHYPPDTTACIFWLKNRQSGKWRDTKDITSGGEKIVPQVVSFAELKDDHTE